MPDIFGELLPDELEALQRRAEELGLADRSPREIAFLLGEPVLGGAAAGIVPLGGPATLKIR